MTYKVGDTYRVRDTYLDTLETAEVIAIIYEPSRENKDILDKRYIVKVTLLGRHTDPLYATSIGSGEVPGQFELVEVH